MSALDVDYVNRAAPPGSMRYFALLYTEPKHRDTLTALFVIDAEIRTSAAQVHEVAHARLEWWRGEIDRLIHRNPQHPATRLLQSIAPTADYSNLQDLITAAAMDLAQMTYQTRTELNGYLERSGCVPAIFANMVAAACESIREVGGLIRRAETLRDLTMDARAGRIYWPLDELPTRHVTIEQLQAGTKSSEVQELFASELTTTEQKLDTAAKSINSSALRPLVVMARLHARLLERIARANYDIVDHRYELGAVDKVWTAWRAARLV